MSNTQRVKTLSSDRIAPKIGLSIDEAAWALGVSRNTLDRMLSEGQLAYALVRSKPVLDPDDLRQLVKKMKVVRNWSKKEISGVEVEEG